MHSQLKSLNYFKVSIPTKYISDMRASLLILMIFLSGFGVAYAQTGASNVYLFEMKWEEGQPQLTNPQYLTDFNAYGYNNQPSFINENQLFISVRSIRDTSQTDIYTLDLEKGTKMRITATAESEYSPMLMPNQFYFSAVRVEADEDRTQRLWQFPLDRVGNGKPIFPTIRNIGYYCWLNTQNVLLYIVGEPNLLLLASTRDGSYVKVTSDIGRCFKRMPNGKVAFVKKESRSRWTLCELDPRSREFKPMITTLAGTEDFEIMEDGSFLMGKGSKLYRYDPKAEVPVWKEIADLKEYEISSITRLTLSKGGKLALVGK
jgi:hypothetical protein